MKNKKEQEGYDIIMNPDDDFDITFYQGLTLIEKKEIFLRVMNNIFNSKSATDKISRGDVIVANKGTLTNIYFYRILKFIDNYDDFKKVIEDKNLLRKFELLVRNYMNNYSMEMYYIENSIKKDIHLKDFIKIIELPEKEFIEFINTSKDFNKLHIKYIYDKIPNYYKYYLNKNVLTNLNYINNLNEKEKKELKKIEEYDNLYTENDFTEKVKISNKFFKYIIKDIPKDYDKLEIAIYLYAKLCETLTYDSVYYFSSAFDYFDKKKKYKLYRDGKVKKIKNINEVKNRVVCFEFSAIYAYFLKKFGIEYYIQDNLKRPKVNYALDVLNGIHQYINLVIDDNIYSVDPTHGMNQEDSPWDLLHYKINGKLNGFVFKKNLYDINNLNEEKFKLKQEKVLKEIYIKSFSKKINDEIDYINQNNITNEEKLNKFVDCINQLNVKGKEFSYAINYILNKINFDCNLTYEEVLFYNKKYNDIAFSSLIIFHFYGRNFGYVFTNKGNKIISDGPLNEMEISKLYTKNKILYGDLDEIDYNYYNNNQLK